MNPPPGPPPRRDRLERLYADELGDKALERQAELARTLHPCCGEPNTGPHHPACHHYIEATEPAIHPDQETLI